VVGWGCDGSGVMIKHAKQVPPTPKVSRWCHNSTTSNLVLNFEDLGVEWLLQANYCGEDGGGSKHALAKQALQTT